ncbi:MAG TPA: glycosyltransferase [Gemmataceae bacterium]|nr:glycosyltransferase [Gemmataceae bacterium]
MRFFYYYPVFRKPTGGLKQIRLMASLLDELGVETYLIRDPSYVPERVDFDDNVYYSVSVKVAPFSWTDAEHYLGAEDVLILPEFQLADILRLCRSWKMRIAVNNQNGFFALQYCPPSRDCSSFIEFAIANAPYVAAISKQYFRLPSERIFLIPHWVARPPFHNAHRDSRKLAICYMPRKLPQQLRQIRDRILHLHPDVPWVEIDGMPEIEVAKRYRENRLFFAAQDTEGCPLTALEAMTCGSLVVGYPGTASFPHPYATPANGIWVTDRDIDKAVTAVQKAIRVAGEGGRAYHSFLEAGTQTANAYRKDVVCDALKDMLAVVQSRDYRRRTISVSNLRWREAVAAYRIWCRHHQPPLSARMLARIARMSGLSRIGASGW